MYNFSLEHIRDPNFMHVGDNTITKHASHTPRQIGYILNVNPVDYTADVQLSGINGNNGQAMVLRNIKVSVTDGGSGWGKHNLPHIGQLVEVTFENGLVTNYTKATIGNRFYTAAQKVPFHPMLLEDRAYHKSQFEMAEGGSFKFKCHDGSITEFKAKPHTAEGSKTNARSTGVAQTASEARMDKSHAQLDSMKTKLKDVQNKASQVKDLAVKAKKLNQLKSYIADLQQRGYQSPAGTTKPYDPSASTADYLHILNYRDPAQLSTIMTALAPLAKLSTISAGAGTSYIALSNNNNDASFMTAIKLALGGAGVRYKSVTGDWYLTSDKTTYIVVQL